MIQKNSLSLEVAEVSSTQLLDDVREFILSCMKTSSLSALVDEYGGTFAGGKMLRASLVMKVGLANAVDKNILLRAAAAVEMIHAASLLHDDVIDRGTLRRGAPSFWVKEGVSGAILLGDLLVCKASGLMAAVAGGSLIEPFIRFSSEMCDAEAEQELVLRGKDMSWAQTVSVARRKTGSLFAFAAYAAAGNDRKKKAAFAESGYDIGTAYQLADDILDAFGDNEDSDKTLGQDANRTKNTAAVSWKLEKIDPLSYIDDLCVGSVLRLDDWPDLRSTWKEFFSSDVEPTIKRFVDKFPVETGS